MVELNRLGEFPHSDASERLQALMHVRKERPDNEVQRRKKENPLPNGI
jgi:hypothetical protein